MQPFFGGRIKQNIAPQANTSRLDSYNGNGSTQIKKREVENMFETSRAPYGNPFGMEDNTDFFQSRIATQAPLFVMVNAPLNRRVLGRVLVRSLDFLAKVVSNNLKLMKLCAPRIRMNYVFSPIPKRLITTHGSRRSLYRRTC
jgi:hypothetical protein